MKYCSILVLMLVLFGCNNKTTDVTAPFDTVSSQPVFTFKSVNATTIANYGDLVFSVEYIDGNGDLGTSNPAEQVLFVEDSRDNITSGFHVQPLNPEPGTSKIIQGTLAVNLDNVILLSDTTTSEQVQFSIYMYDQSGNKSNVIVSPIITINR